VIARAATGTVPALAALAALVGGARAQDARAPAAERATFHVSVAGRDEWSGTLARPAADGSDGPFASVARAQRAVRALLAAGAPEGPPVVSIAGGRYELERPLVFAPDDSGAEGAPVVYRARAGERPVLSGGRRVGGWTVGDDGRWRATLADVRAGAWSFAQLFVNDQRRFRPRLPRAGYHLIAASVEPSAQAAGRGHDRFGYAEGDVDPDWSRIEDVELFARNVVYWTNASPLLAGNWQDEGFDWEENLLWNPGHAELCAPGRRGGSLVADPLFVDPARDDYRLRPDSPALALGIELLDPELVGPPANAAATSDLPPVPAGFH